MDNEEFKSKYISYEARIRDIYSKYKVTDVIVRKSNTGKDFEKIIGKKYYFAISDQQKYEKVFEAAEKVREELKKESKTTLPETELITPSELFKLKNLSLLNPNDPYDELCSNFLPREEDEKIRSESESCEEDKKNRHKKINIKSKPKKFDKIKKYVVRAIKIVAVSTVVACSVLLPEAYKQKVAIESLSILKDNLNAATVWDNTTYLSSGSYLTRVEINGNNGKKYVYEAEGGDGYSCVHKDAIKNQKVVNAVICVAHAQDGNLIDAIEADKITKKMKKNPYEYKYPGNDENILEKNENNLNENSYDER